MKAAEGRGQGGDDKADYDPDQVTRQDALPDRGTHTEAQGAYKRGQGRGKKGGHHQILEGGFRDPGIQEGPQGYGKGVEDGFAEKSETADRNESRNGGTIDFCAVAMKQEYRKEADCPAVEEGGAQPTDLDIIRDQVTG